MSLKDITFNHFKIHTQYSICEGAVKIEELAKYAKLSKFLSLGISDSYNLSGALEFSEELSKAGVHPIIGTQLNIKTDNIIGKVSLIAKNEVGYKNLLKLSSKSYLDINATEAPHCSIKDLLDFNSGLFVLLGGNHTLTSQLILNNQDKIFLNNVSKLKSTFKDNLFFEIQRHNEVNENRIENFLIANSKSLKVPIIASQEVFYINQDMYEAHDAYICIGQKAYVEDKNRINYSDQHYLKSNEEMLKLFADLPDALENNHNLRYQCLYRPLPSKPLLPNFTSTSSTEKNVEVVLQELAQKGLEIRLKEVILKKITDPKQIEETKKIYVDRLNYDYFLKHLVNQQTI